MTRTGPKFTKVFILLGQSNMVGMGKVDGKDVEGTLEHAVKVKKRYPFLVDEDSNGNCCWKDTIDDHVRNVFIMGSGISGGSVKKNEWLTVKNTKTIGPEIGIGHALGNWLRKCNHDDDYDILILKSCIGNRSLGWDLLPPGTPPFEYDDEKTGKRWHYAGYNESPNRWEVGTNPKPISWHAGCQYDGDIRRVKEILADITKCMPNTTKECPYEIAGFLFWQGDKDRYDMAYAKHYKQNLVHFIKQLRVEFSCPNAKFVLATLGQTSYDHTTRGTDDYIFDAQIDVPNMPEFIGNTACAYSKPFCHGGASNSHYNCNAETFMDVGLEMGRVMTELL